jgi:hypothetical protein
MCPGVYYTSVGYLAARTISAITTKWHALAAITSR